jgi:hypothetical protein
LDGLVVNNAASVNIGQCLKGQTTTLFFLIYPSGQGLLDDPVFGAFQAFSHQVDLFGQLHWDMSRYGSGFRGGCHDGVTPNRYIFLNLMSPDPAME